VIEDSGDPLLGLIGPLHSPAGLPDEAGGAVVGEGRIGTVAIGAMVGVGCGVSVGASVGGTGVSVGMASWVMASMVFAAAIAEACMSAGSTVGVAFVPHALDSNTRMVAEVNNNLDFMDFFLPFTFLMGGYGILLGYVAM